MSEPIPTQGTVKRCGNCGTAYLPSRVHKHDCIQSLQSQLNTANAERDKYREYIAEIRQTNHAMNGFMCIDKLCEQALSETSIE